MFSLSLWLIYFTGLFAILRRDSSIAPCCLEIRKEQAMNKHVWMIKYIFLVQFPCSHNRGCGWVKKIVLSISKTLSTSVIIPMCGIVLVLNKGTIFSFALHHLKWISQYESLWIWKLWISCAATELILTVHSQVKLFSSQIHPDTVGLQWVHNTIKSLYDGLSLAKKSYYTIGHLIIVIHYSGFIAPTELPG